MQELLVERARRGDRDAFAALAARVIDRCYGLAYAILRDAELAHDAVQDALLGAWRDLPKLREVDKFEAWLHSLVVHAWYAQSRRERRWTRAISAFPTDARGRVDRTQFEAVHDGQDRTLPVVRR